MVALAPAGKRARDGEVGWGSAGDVLLRCCPPSLAHALHESFLSSQTWVQTPQVAGQTRFMWPGLSVHWSSMAQTAHAVVLVSLHACTQRAGHVSGQPPQAAGCKPRYGR